MPFYDEPHTFEEVQNHIFELLEASELPQVYETALPAGAHPAKDKGYIVPYVLVGFGGKSPVAQRNQGITSSREDVKWTAVAIEVIGSSQKDVRKATGIVRDVLEGLIPHVSWGELSETLSGDYAVKVPDSDVWPVRYGQTIVFNGLSNAVTN